MNATTTTNHPNFDNAMTLAQRVGSNVKTLRENKRKLYASIVLAVCVEEFDRKTMLDDVKRKAKYGAMDKSDQALIRRELSNCGTVIDNWPHFTDVQREAFLNGEIASEDAKAFPDGDWPATLAVNSLAAHCKARDKAADSADTEGETAPETGETGETAPETEEPTVQVPFDRETFTIADVVQMILSGDERTLPIFEAVEAFNASALETAAA